MMPMTSMPRAYQGWSAEAELDIVRRWQDRGDEKARARLLEAFYTSSGHSGEARHQAFPARSMATHRGCPARLILPMTGIEIASTSWLRSASSVYSWRPTASISESGYRFIDLRR